MILLKIQDSPRIEGLHPKLKMLFDFIKTHDLTNHEKGRIALEGDNVFINVDEPTLIQKEDQKMEVHQKYMDIHFPLDKTETIGWRALSDITIPPVAPFNVEKDFAFYAVPASTYVEVHPGECLILYPEDAHAPIIGEGTMKKLVGKIKLEND